MTVTAERPGAVDRLQHVLDTPLLGLVPGRTIVAIAYLTVVLGLTLVRRARPAVLALGFDPLLPVLDQLSALAIVLTTLSMTVVPIAYALWNGGPVTASALGIVGPLSGSLTAGVVVFDVDLALAFATAGVAATVAVLRVAVTTGDRSVPGPYLGIVDGLTVATIVTGLAGVGLSVVTLGAADVPVLTVGVVGVGGATVGLVVGWGIVGRELVAPSGGE